MRSLSLFVTLGALSSSIYAQPTIQPNGIVNASGYQSILAPDTVFVIFGSGLGPATIQTAPAPNYPVTLSDTFINFTPASGGPAITASMIYTLSTQVAGVLPSSIAPGTYAVTVNYQNQTSASQNVTVVPRSLGIATANSAGTGPAQASIGNVNNGISLVRMTAGGVNFGGFTYILTPAHPGDELVLWGTGGGADSANDTGGTSGDQTAAGNFSISVDGTQITPLYSGTSSGYPGLWQVNFVLPSNIASDCFASVQVTGGGQTSNPVTIAIAPAGQSSCSSVIPASTLSKLDSGTGTITMAGLIIGQTVTGSTPGAQGIVGGVINRYSVGEFILPYIGPKYDLCTVLDETYPAGTKEPSAADATLDAGDLTVSGPGLPALAVSKIAQPLGPVYNSAIPLTPGNTYTLSADGGPDIGRFSISATYPASFQVTNLSALSTVNRSQPLTVNWTGSGFNQVLIDITTQIQASTVHSVTVTCPVPAAPGSYTVPAAALAHLLSNPTVAQLQITSSTNRGGITSAESTTDPNTTIPLTAGGLVDFGSFAQYIDFFVKPTIQ